MGKHLTKHPSYSEEMVLFCIFYPSQKWGVKGDSYRLFNNRYSNIKIPVALANKIKEEIPEIPKPRPTEISEALRTLEYLERKKNLIGTKDYLATRLYIFMGLFSHNKATYNALEKMSKVVDDFYKKYR